MCGGSCGWVNSNCRDRETYHILAAVCRYSSRLLFDVTYVSDQTYWLPSLRLSLERVTNSLLGMASLLESTAVITLKYYNIEYVHTHFAGPQSLSVQPLPQKLTKTFYKTFTINSQWTMSVNIEHSCYKAFITEWMLFRTYTSYSFLCA